ncbi:Acyl-CoA dehydrogenase domain protein [Desulfatibacillum aliphaticivorans]|uniref:Acyl-CoA dehydrogenase domain protein n=1 Tax=Desulfatibacillum aliphaticivorans TaxID=218208 RepID=B8FLD2_DESAL|nr:acyl-CoA dehydrogenase family protein [Desulfatibacillum aliphaticivorans]ACL05078.1 Acyl-CoA dehydrogenase domain protein [Desulfatibacillum aliphaticivorans]
MDEKLSREHEMVVDAVRHWVKKECPRMEAMAWDESGQIPSEVLKTFKALDLWAMGVDEQYGGTGLDWTGITLVSEALSEMEPTLAGMFVTDMWGAAAILAGMGTEEQKTSLLPQLAEGKISLARVQANTSLVEGIEFREDQDGWVLNGNCKHVNNVKLAQVLVVQAVAESDPDTAAQFLVPVTGKGVTITLLETLGYRNGGPGSVYMENVSLPHNALVGNPGKPGKVSKTAARVQGAWDLLTAAQAVGMAQGAMSYALEHAKGRIQFDQPIGRFPALREKFVDLSAMIRASRLLVRTAAALADAGQNFHTQAAQALLVASSTAEKAGLEVVQILGGYGYTLEYDAQRYFRNAMQLVCSVMEKSSLHKTIGYALGL